MAEKMTVSLGEMLPQEFANRFREDLRLALSDTLAARWQEQHPGEPLPQADEGPGPSAAQLELVARRHTTDAAAAREALAFMRSLSASRAGASRGRKWTRESLYEDRIGRWAKS